MASLNTTLRLAMAAEHSVSELLDNPHERLEMGLRLLAPKFQSACLSDSLSVAGAFSTGALLTAADEAKTAADEHRLSCHWFGGKSPDLLFCIHGSISQRSGR
jgi:hypothetical protein